MAGAHAAWGSWLVLKALPLAIPLIGLLKHRMYTYRWVSLLVWIYFTEGVVRAWSDPAPGRWLALLEVFLCLMLFTACALHVRWRQRSAARPRRPAAEPPFSCLHVFERSCNMTALLERLRQIVGEAHVLTEGDLVAYEQDWRRRVRGKSLAVVRPASTAEVAAVVRECAAAGTSIIPQGGNTGLSVGSTPDDSGTQVVLSLTRMNAVRNIDRDNLSFTVEAGCILQSLQELAEKEGLLFPLSLAAEGSCTIGGNLGTNAGGTQVVRYGNTRELCLGLEVVTRRARSGTASRACARTTPATTCATCSSAAKARWASSPPPP